MLDHFRPPIVPDTEDCTVGQIVQYYHDLRSAELAWLMLYGVGGIVCALAISYFVGSLLPCTPLVILVPVLARWAYAIGHATGVAAEVSIEMIRSRDVARELMRGGAGGLSIRVHSMPEGDGEWN